MDLSNTVNTIYVQDDLVVFCSLQYQLQCSEQDATKSTWPRLYAASCNVRCSQADLVTSFPLCYFVATQGNN